MDYTQDYKQDKPNNERNKKSGCTAPIIIFIVIALIIFIPLAIITEDATLDDITVSNQQMSLLNFSFDFIPKQNIDNLSFEISFYDKNNKYISSIKRDFGNVNKGQQYTFTLNYAELFVNAWQADGTTIKINGKKHILPFL